MDATAVVPTKSRAKLFEKTGYPFVRSLGIDYVINVERQQKQEYGYLVGDKNVVYSKNNIGVKGAVENAAKHARTGIVFKIDDDISGFTGDLAGKLPMLIGAFKKYDRLGAIAFPYQQEFYYNKNTLFSHYNCRLQTAYIIRKELVGGEGIYDPFEDFCQFIKLRTLGYFTLLSPTTKIVCKPVGETPGGLNEGQTPRRERALEAIIKIQQYYPALCIGIKNRPGKSWLYEPDFSKEPLLKKKPI